MQTKEIGMERTFKAIDRHGAEMEFELILPTDLLERESEMEYRKAYSAAIKEGILPREKMREIFKENGIWTKTDDDNFTQLVREIGGINLKLDDATKRGDQDECIKLAGEMGLKRVRLLQLFTVQQASYMQSCEGYAEIVRLEALMASCVVIKANKQRYWKTYRDYVLERDHNEKSTVARGAMEINNAVLESRRDDVIAEYPEQRWLKQLHAEQVEKAKEDAKQLIAERVKEALSANKVEGGNNEGDSGN
jgi:hypothetical protein